MTLLSQMIPHPAVLRKVRKETLKKRKGKRKIKKPISLYFIMKYRRGQTNAQIGKWLQMKGLLRVQRTTKWETFFSFSCDSGYLQLLHLGALPVTCSAQQNWEQSCPVPSTYVLTDFYFGLLNLILLLLIGNLVFCYEGFLRLFFAINYI